MNIRYDAILKTDIGDYPVIIEVDCSEGEQIYIAYLKDIPAVVAQGKNIIEVQKELIEGLHLLTRVTLKDLIDEALKSTN